MTNTKTTQDRLKDQVEYIAEHINRCFEGELNQDDEQYTAFDYVCEALDINYVVNSDKTYKSARILVAFGGPNIWIDTATKKIEGYWWNDYAEAYYDDEVGLDQACEELFNC